MDLAQYLIDFLGSVATFLEWDTNTARLTVVVNDTLQKMGLDSSDDITTALEPKAKAIGKFYLLSALLLEFSLFYDFKADKGDYKQSQMFKQLKTMFEQAKIDVVGFVDEGIIYGEFNYTEDIYQNEPELSEF